MELKEVVILAGGLGTRLKSEINDLPKCLAPINGFPFLHYLINYLKKNGLKKFVFSLGYQSHAVIKYLVENYSNLDSSFAVEPYPLLTGGAIKFAAKYCSEENVLIVNADTFFDIDLNLFFSNHLLNNAHCSLALKKLEDFDRYGVVNIIDNRVVSFEEKKYYETGLINGGIYILNLPSFNAIHFDDTFSFEKEYLEFFFNEKQIFGFEFDNYFVDIGVPLDYWNAHNATEFKN